MCGFTGVIFSGPSAKESCPFSLDSFRKSSRRIAHRGDTEHREYINEFTWLNHFRLAFQDVQSGTQPMRSQDGRHVIVFNGEVYNHLELRKQIQKQSSFEFRTRSDTETILEGWKLAGDSFFNGFDGEFAFLIIDLATREIIAHRDRYGVKPLFLRLPGIDTRLFSIYRSEYRCNTTYLEVASEIKGLCGKKGWQRDGLLRQFVGLYEPICTPFENIIQLPPGATFKTSSTGGGFSCTLLTKQQPVRYANNTSIASAEEFEQAFRKAVTNRLLSDVELGVYLSGGVDSKSVAYELAKARPGSNPIKSFTVGFEQAGYDETSEAVQFAKYLGFKPHVLHIDDAALNYAYPLAVQTSELVQPYTNGAAKWWLSLFTREYVQGVLTGDGADEVFCGYPSYRYVNWWRYAMRERGKSRSWQQLAGLLDKKPLGQSVRDGLYLGRFAAHKKNPWLAGSSAEGNGSDFINSLAMWGVPHPLFGQIQTITHAVMGPDEGERWLKEQGESIRSLYSAGLPGLEHDLANPEHALLLWQNYFAQAHLPVLILNWVGDRMEMSNTLEGRTPFLSSPVYNLMSQQKDTQLVHGLRDKVLLRRTYARLLPQHFVHTPKKQFNAPLLDAASLTEKFQTATIFEKTGLANNDSFHQLNDRARAIAKDRPYEAIHLRTTHQTALALSIVNHCVAADQVIERDNQLETRYLGKVKTDL